MKRFFELKRYVEEEYGESDEEIKQLYQAKKDNFNALEKMKNNMDMRTLAKMVFHWQYDDN